MSVCPHRDDAGAWVLGALAEPDARRFAAHLGTCEGCRREVAELQVVADVLPLGAPQVLPPPELKDEIMQIVGSEAALLAAAGPAADLPPARPSGAARRLRPLLRRGPLSAAALAVTMLAVGVLGGALLSGGTDTTTRPGFGPQGAQVALRVGDDHGELVLHGMPAAPAGRVYQVWLVQGRGAPRPTHTLFAVPRDGRATVAIMESMRGIDQILITAEPAGGSAHPTSKPLAGATLT